VEYDGGGVVPPAHHRSSRTTSSIYGRSRVRVARAEATDAQAAWLALSSAAARPIGPSRAGVKPSSLAPIPVQDAAPNAQRMRLGSRGRSVACSSSAGRTAGGDGGGCGGGRDVYCYGRARGAGREQAAALEALAEEELVEADKAL
jgi:hypothetical protein